jgi:hypothetical protein
MAKRGGKNSTRASQQDRAREKKAAMHATPKPRAAIEEQPRRPADH